MTEIVLAQGSLLRELFAFRHRVYVDELGAVDLRDSSGELIEAFDGVAWNYAAVSAGHVVGSLRVVDWTDMTDAEKISNRYGVEPLVNRFESRSVCHAGRLAVAEHLRRSSCLVRLVARAVEDAVARGIRFSVSDCSPCLFGLYQRLGYVRTFHEFRDPDFGLKWPMVWCLRDLEGMRRIGSPIARVVATCADDGEGRDWLRASGFGSECDAADHVSDRAG